jgi:protein-S-isoprenylcysteine O-methyltransferase Ste14
MQPDLHLYADAAWVAIGLLWLAGAVTAKRPERIQAGGSRLLQILLATVAFSLVFRPTGSALLDRQVLPDSSAIAYAGLILTFAGIIIAGWARLMLGGNWSAIVTIKKDHTIVRRGPYAIVRHPIYSGGLLGLLGTALVSGEVRALIAWPLVFVTWWAKLRLEERFMTDRFGAEYLQYQREVKALIPYVL